MEPEGRGLPRRKLPRPRIRKGSPRGRRVVSKRARLELYRRAWSSTPKGVVFHSEGRGLPRERAVKGDGESV